MNLRKYVNVLCGCCVTGWTEFFKCCLPFNMQTFTLNLKWLLALKEISSNQWLEHISNRLGTLWTKSGILFHTFIDMLRMDSRSQIGSRHYSSFRFDDDYFLTISRWKSIFFLQDSSSTFAVNARRLMRKKCQNKLLIRSSSCDQYIASKLLFPSRVFEVCDLLRASFWILFIIMLYSWDMNETSCFQ